MVRLVRAVRVRGVAPLVDEVRILVYAARQRLGRSGSRAPGRRQGLVEFRLGRGEGGSECISFPRERRCVEPRQRFLGGVLSGAESNLGIGEVVGVVSGDTQLGARGRN